MLKPAPPLQSNTSWLGGPPRPTFQKIGLSEFRRFIATEDLEKLVAKVDDLVEDTAGIVTPNIVDAIALELEQEAESSLQ